MALDASIPLAALGRGPTTDPFQVAQSLSTMQVQRQNARSLEAEREAAIAQKNEAVEKAQRQAADDAAFKAAVQASAGMTPDAFLEHVRTTAPGSYLAVQKATLEAQDKAASAKKAAEDAAAAHANAALHQQDYLGHLADQIQQSDYNPAVVNAALNMAVQAFPEWKEHAEQIRQVAATQGKEALAQIVGSLITPESQRARSEQQNVAAQIPGNVADSAVKQQVAAGTKNGMTPAQQAADRREGQRVAIAQATNQREDDKFKATYGQGKDDNGQPVISPLAKSIAEYRQPGLTGRAASTAYGAALMNQVLAANPGYDATQFPSRNRMRIAFSSGTQGQQINAMNTALGHLDQLSDAADALNNGKFGPGNALYNTLKQTFGDAAPTNFNTLKEFLNGELGAVVKKGSATEGEMAQLRKDISRASSPAQLRGFIETAVDVLGSKLDALNYQYKQTMGDKDPFSPLSPEAQAIVGKYRKTNGPTNPSHDVAAGTVTVVDPRGVAHVFPNQAAADKFKQAAGIK